MVSVDELWLVDFGDPYPWGADNHNRLVRRLGNAQARSQPSSRTNHIDDTESPPVLSHDPGRDRPPTADQSFPQKPLIAASRSSIVPVTGR